MKNICFFLFLLNLPFCYISKGQDVSNSKNFHDEKAIKSIFPPQLSNPVNESTIDIKYPVFIWMPPAPLNTMLVTYSIRLVEVKKGQTLAEALLQNPPLLNLSGISNSFLNYPADAMPLQNGSTYAWQVAASYGGQSLGVTDIGSFSVKKNEIKKTDATNYPVASKVSKERFYISNGAFHFVYNNSTNEKTLSYTIKRMDKSMESFKGLPKIELRPGMNSLQVNLKQSGKLKNGTYYYLEITDKKKQVYKLMYYYVET
jgi:hypothetical protein